MGDARIQLSLEVRDETSICFAQLAADQMAMEFRPWAPEDLEPLPEDELGVSHAG